MTNVVILHHLFAGNGNWPLLAVLCSVVILHAHYLLAKHCTYQQQLPQQVQLAVPYYQGI